MVTKVDIEVMEWLDSLTLIAKFEDREVGRMNVTLKPFGAKVTSIIIEKPFQRQGVATQIYQVAAKKACEIFNQPLISGISRSPAAEEFWRKQLNKDRAEILVDEETGVEYYSLHCPPPRSLAESKGTLRIPDAAFSYIETDVAEVVDDPEGYELSMEEYIPLKTIMLYTDMENQSIRIPTSPGDRKIIADAFDDMSNAIDDDIEYGSNLTPRIAANARRAFSTLANKLR